MYTIKNYETGATLEGRPSTELREASLIEGDTGAVYAYLDDYDVWQYVRPQDYELMNNYHNVLTVFVY